MEQETKNANLIASTPAPPYYAVIFTSVRTAVDENYAQTAERMVELAHLQPGFLGVESAREDVGITVSYWKSLEDVKNWKYQSEHVLARDRGREFWYEGYKTRICKVERDYGFQTL